MPIYEFECRKCGHKFDKLCSFSASQDGIECPSCTGTDTKKLVSGFFARTSGGSSSGSSCSCGGTCGGNCGSSCAGCHH